MPLPPISSSVWEDLVTGRTVCNLEFLATKILLGRAGLSLRRDPSLQNQMNLIRELYELLKHNADHPAVQRDIEAILRANDQKGA